MVSSRSSGKYWKTRWLIPKIPSSNVYKHKIWMILIGWEVCSCSGVPSLTANTIQGHSVASTCTITKTIKLNNTQHPHILQDSMTNSSTAGMPYMSFALEYDLVILHYTFRLQIAQTLNFLPWCWPKHWYKSYQFLGILLRGRFTTFLFC